ncbi:MAG: hypothetical protein KF713_08665 [Turneriella sp.]|nr:hypothetical protein [Turneriella sp.]
MKTRIALFANSGPGLEIAEFLKKQSDDEIVCLYLADHYPEIDAQIRNVVNLPSERVFAHDSVKNDNHVNWFRSQNIDFIITVYWPYLLKFSFLQLARDSVNFHPALLPINRGWYPHVHSIIDGSKTGVTLHRMDAGADTGPVWYQKEVPVLPTDDAKALYVRLQSAIIAAFAENWSRIKSGKIIPSPQDESLAVYHAKKEIDTLDEIDLNKTYKAADLINLLRARTFGNKGFAYYYSEGKKIRINIRLNEE